MKLKDWRAKGEFKTIRGQDVFFIDTGGNKPALCILHGYPSSSIDYYHVLTYWSNHFRVIVHDHIGFGLSAKPQNYSYSLIEQAEVALELWKSIGLKEAHLLAHDYGTSVATEIIARQNFGYKSMEVLTATLTNGSMLIHLAQLLLSQKLLRNPVFGPILSKLSTRWYFHYNFKKIWWDKSTYNKAEMDIVWDLLIANGGREVLPKVTQYLSGRYQFWHRWVPNGLYKTTIPINILWADKDPIAVIEMAHVLHKNIPNNQLNVLENIGHFPMLEAPGIYGKAVVEMIFNRMQE